MDEVVPDGIESTTCTFMLHVPDRQRGGFPLVAPDVGSKKLWMSVLNDVIDSTRTTPQVMQCLPSSYDEDLERSSQFSNTLENSFDDHRNSSASEASSN